jgi:hypothetical protein
MNALLKYQTVTEFARNPNRALKKIDQGDIILRRTKGKEAIRLTLASRAESASAGIDQAARALGLLVKAMDPTPPVMARALESQYPWVRFLSETGRVDFAHEFIDTLVASASLGNFAPMDALVHSWKSTAEIRSDPELYAKLKASSPAPPGPAVSRP